MFKLKPEELKAHVLQRWALQYNIDQSTDEYHLDKRNCYLSDEMRIRHLVIYRNIKALPENCARHQIDNIIGNDGRTEAPCSFCGKLTCLTELIQPDSFYNDSISSICEYCVSTATDIIKLG